MRNSFLWKTIIWIGIAVWLISIFTITLVRNKIITGRPEDILSITVHVTPELKNAEPVNYTISNKNDILDFIRTLRQGEVDIKLHPGHWQSFQCDIDAIVYVSYSDNSSDELLITKFGPYRMLDTRGGSGDPGFIGLDNHYIYGWIVAHIPD